jgi:hypothetical protein
MMQGQRLMRLRQKGGDVLYREGPAVSKQVQKQQKQTNPVHARRVGGGKRAPREEKGSGR